MNALQFVKHNLLNIPGWRTNRKIIVIESDDWGSIRMPSQKVYDTLLNNGIRVDLCPYNKFDNLANREDLNMLFDTLLDYKDIKGNHPVITANTNIANPDFEKIKQSDFKQFFFKYFNENLKEYYKDDDIFSIWEEGINSKIFYPQLHGREHVNSILWMQLLRDNHKEIRKAFDYNVFGLSRITTPNIKKLYLASLIFTSNDEEKIIKSSLYEGANIFSDLFGYRSKSFIAPVYIWDKKLEKTFYDIGIEFIQGGNAHMNLNHDTGKTYRVKRHFMGDENRYNQIYLVRNCFFEPSLNPNKYSFLNTLREIETAFKWNKPAIISSHRLNFIGSLNRENREKNNTAFNELIINVLKKWPNVEFMTSVDLGELIKKSRQ